MGTRPNRRFGRYEVLEEIGHGAMGVVYRARDPKINRDVAIKSISIDKKISSTDADIFRQRFLREAEAAGRLSHPGIVTIFDVCEEPDTHDPYIVMEWIKGQSLDQVLKEKGKLSPGEAMQLVSELADALDCAHGQNVIHRDLKPANILITEDGHPKIADFGVAKLNLENLTMHGEVWGTPAFMSPEQLQGEAIDGRSDVFSLGVILYMLLTGHGPFQGNSPITVSFKVLNHNPIPAGVLNLDLPPGIDHVLARAMAKNPAARYQRAMEMSLDLQNILAGREPWSKAKKSQTITGSQRASLNSQPQRGLWLRVPIAFLRAHRLQASIALVALFGMVLAAASLRRPRFSPGAPPPIATPSAPATTAIAQSGEAHSPTPPATRQTSKSDIRTVASTKGEAVMDLRLEYPFQQGNLSLWVDERPVLHHPLEFNAKRTLGFLGRGRSHHSEQLRIPSGMHRVRVRVQSQDRSCDESRTLSADFPTGADRILDVSVDRHGEMNASLK